MRSERRKFIRAAAGILSAVLAFPAILAAEPVYATESGMLYGTVVDDTDNDGGVSIGNDGAQTGSSGSGVTIGGSDSGSTMITSGSTTSVISSSGNKVSIGTSESGSYSLSGTSSYTTAVGSTSSSVSIGTSSSSSVSIGSSSSSSSSVSSDTSGLLYGSVVTNLYGNGGSFLTIEGGSSSSLISGNTWKSDNASFNQTYVALEIYAYLRQQGFSSAAACGVLGNIMRESGMDPEAFNSNGASFGLFQCLGDLKTRLYNYCSANGLDVNDAMAQTQCMILDMAPDIFVIYGKTANMTYSEFKQMTDPSEAAEVWRSVVERNHYSAYDTSQRQEFAEAFYSKWKNYDGSGMDIIQEAVKYIGNPYVWGGDSLTMGIDCSHFVCRILRMTGHYTGEYRTSYALRTVGTEVASLADAQPGDILCWNGHVALYIADGYYVNAAGKATGICIGGGDITTKLGGLITIRRVR